jgi:hypothetical protein
MQSSLFWHSALPLQTCAWPWVEEVLSVGHVLAQCVFALVDVAMPQHTWPEGQSLSPSQLNAAVSRGHMAPCSMHLPVGLFWASSPTQHVCVRRSQFGVEPQGAMVGELGSDGRPASLTGALPASARVPELEPDELEVDPELEPEELEVDPELEPELEPDDEPPPPLVPSSACAASSPKGGSPLLLLPHAEAAKQDPAIPQANRSDQEAFDR